MPGAFQKIAEMPCEMRYNPHGPMLNASIRCPRCNGTGYRFPWLWVECQGNTIVAEWGKDDVPIKSYSTHDAQAPCKCEHTGYLLLDAEGDQLLGLLRVARKERFSIRIGITGRVQVQFVEDEDSPDFAITSPLPDFFSGDTLEEALLKALEDNNATTQ